MNAQREASLKHTDANELDSGCWLIRCGSMSHREELRQHLPGDLLLRQLRRFHSERLLICDPATPIDQGTLRQLTNPSWLDLGPPSSHERLRATEARDPCHASAMPTNSVPPTIHPGDEDGAVDCIWDADVLHGLALAERLQLISQLDRRLSVGSSWISVARDHSGFDPRWGAPLSPEEVVGYFCPAYQVVHQEALSVGTGPEHAMTFSTLVLTKRSEIAASQLDLELQRGIEAVAAERRWGAMVSRRP